MRMRQNLILILDRILPVKLKSRSTRKVLSASDGGGLNEVNHSNVGFCPLETV